MSASVLITVPVMLVALFGTGLRTPRWSAAVGAGDDECQRSVVEGVPADGASALLVIKDQLSNLHRNSFSLPVSFPDTC
jgi:hypothetical protein